MILVDMVILVIQVNLVILVNMAKLVNLMSSTLRFWGHLGFHYYLGITDPVLQIFSLSKIISMTFLNIYKAN